MKRIITLTLFFIGLLFTASAQVNNFGLIDPPNNLEVYVEGERSTFNQISWHSGGAAVANYMWYIDTLGGGLMNPLDSAMSDNSGTDTTLTLSIGQIENLVIALGLNKGDTAHFIWTVFATDTAGIKVSSVDTFNLSLIRGDVYDNYSLISPANNATLNLNGNSASSATISWHSAGPGFTYEWLANAPGAGFTPPLLNFASNNSGNDTSLTLTFSAINNLLGSLGVNLGDTATIEWTVAAYGAFDTIYSVDTFSVSLVRGAIINTPVLSTPATNTTLQVGGPSTNMVSASWFAAGDSNLTYIWQYETSFGNFNNPLLSFATQDTFIHVSIDTLRDILTTQGTPLNGLFLGKWRVRAQASNNYTINSANRNLNLQRRVVIDPFNLTSPANSSSVNVSGDGKNTVTVNWDNAGFGVSYVWYLLNPITGDTIISVPTGVNQDSLVLTYNDIDILLESNNVPVGATVPFNWDVAAFSTNGSIDSDNGPFSLSVTRGNVIRIYTYTSPANNTNLDLFGVESKLLTATWTNSGASINYIWQLDSVGKSYSNPLLSISTSTDTFVSLPYSAVENLLISLGYNIGETANLQWRVNATNGTDTVYNNSFNLNITRNPLIKPFNLVSPSTGAAVAIEGRFDNLLQPMWQSASKSNAIYQWLLDTVGGNFSNPYIVLNSDSSGEDSTLTLTYEDVEFFLESEGIEIGETFSGIWTVRAISQTDTIIASNTNTIDATRGAVMYPFSLTVPGNGAGLKIEGLDTDVISPAWEKSTDTLITYGFYLDTVGGGFSQPLVYLNTSTDTSASFTMGTLNQLLVSLGVPYNGFRTFEWYTEAYSAGDTLASTSVNTVSFSRGTVLSNFNQLTPASGTFLVVEGDGRQIVDITWTNSSPDGEPIYDWLLDVPSGNFSAPLASVVSNNNGNDTALTLNFNQIDGLLANLGLAVGDTITAIWSARANGGFKTLLASNNPSVITLVRGDVIRPFDLKSPSNQTILEVTGNGNKTAEISWEIAGTGNISYEWFLDVPGGNFTNPIVSLPANNSGNDTTLTITFPDIESLLIANGLNIGDTLKAIWDVEASNAAGSAFSANGPYEIWIVRGSVITPFTLTSPANNTRLVVQGDASTPVNIAWSAAGAGNYNYDWMIDLPGGNFSPPLAQLKSDNNGTATTLSLDFAAVDNLLASLGLALGDSVNAIWTVRANEGNDVVQSQNTFNIKFVRGALTVPFDLVGPIDGTTLSIPGNSIQNLNISWENADYLGKTGTLNYNWLLDVPSGDFSNPVTSIAAENNGKATNLVLPYADIYNLLNANGLDIGDRIDLKWTVKASLLQLEEMAQSEFEISFIKLESIGVDELNTKVTSKIYPNPSNGNFAIELNTTENGLATIELIDVIGKVITTSNRQVVNGKNILLFNNNLPSGFYIVRIKTNNEVLESRISITH